MYNLVGVGVCVCKGLFMYLLYVRVNVSESVFPRRISKYRLLTLLSCKHGLVPVPVCGIVSASVGALNMYRIICNIW